VKKLLPLAKEKSILGRRAPAWAVRGLA